MYTLCYNITIVTIQNKQNKLYTMMNALISFTTLTIVLIQLKHLQAETLQDSQIHHHHPADLRML